jgi:hypothetical protein
MTMLNFWFCHHFLNIPKLILSRHTLFKQGTRNVEEQSTEGEAFCQPCGNKLHVRKTITETTMNYKRSCSNNKTLKYIKTNIIDMEICTVNLPCDEQHLVYFITVQ